MIAIVGPTGVGKTEFALRISSEIDSEIVNCDSRQIYQGMDIGTAKPTQKQTQMVPHHLFDICAPTEIYDLHRYQDHAKSAVSEIKSRNKIPILVGGSGQYLWSLVENWDLGNAKPNPDLRGELDLKVSNKQGMSELLEELKVNAPDIYNNIDILNPRRVVRGVEKLRAGETCYGPRKRGSGIGQWFLIGLTNNREQLYKRVDERADRMVSNGWISETKRLLSDGWGAGAPSMSSIGYRELGLFLDKRLTWELCMDKIKSRTHRLIRTQYNWFKMSDARINWKDLGSTGERSVIREIKDALNELKA